MKLTFTGNVKKLQKGITLLSAEWGFAITEDGIPIVIEQSNDSELYVSLIDQKGYIRYQNKIHFFRALGLFLEHAAKATFFEIKEEPQFTMNGPMLDCSRNAVMKPEAIKKMLRVVAMMGLNSLLLYMEDTYVIEDEPYFGYFRGRYSKEELKDVDDYADLFGIEVIPCIQTLAHLSTFLRWDVTSDIRDTDDILLVKSEKTYQFIEKMIQSASTPFRSKRIHIGMDEAHLLGRGKYQDLHGYESRFEIMSKHLSSVLEITSKYNLRPMIWSDMYFRMGSDDGSYYDLEAIIPQSVMDKLPRNVQFVYWDYYHEDEGFYQTYIKKHIKFGSTPIFAGGIWTFNGVSIQYDKTIMSTNAALSACKKEGIKEVFATLWGDNGAEVHPFASLVGLQIYAEHGYTKKLDIDKLNNRFKFCTGADINAFLQLGKIDVLPTIQRNENDVVLEPDNPSKYLLWQDPLLGLFDKHFEGINIQSFYMEMEKILRNESKNVGQWDTLFTVPIQLCSVLYLKSDIGQKLKKYYDEKNDIQLNQLASITLVELKERVHELRDAHYQQWMETHKPFGWEILDIRYGGLIARIDTSIKRLKDYLQGNITSIPELEENRLIFSSEISKNGVGRCNVYTKIVSTNVM